MNKKLKFWWKLPKRYYFFIKFYKKKFYKKKINKNSFLNYNFLLKKKNYKFNNVLNFIVMSSDVKQTECNYKVNINSKFIKFTKAKILKKYRILFNEYRQLMLLRQKEIMLQKNSTKQLFGGKGKKNKKQNFNIKKPSKMFLSAKTKIKLLYNFLSYKSIYRDLKYNLNRKKLNLTKRILFWYLKKKFIKLNKSFLSFSYFNGNFFYLKNKFLKNKFVNLFGDLSTSKLNKIRFYETFNDIYDNQILFFENNLRYIQNGNFFNINKNLNKLQDTIDCETGDVYDNKIWKNNQLQEYNNIDNNYKDGISKKSYSFSKLSNLNYILFFQFIKDFLTTNTGIHPTFLFINKVFKTEYSILNKTTFKQIYFKANKKNIGVYDNEFFNFSKLVFKKHNYLKPLNGKNNIWVWSLPKNFFDLNFFKKFYKKIHSNQITQFLFFQQIVSNLTRCTLVLNFRKFTTPAMNLFFFFFKSFSEQKKILQISLLEFTLKFTFLFLTKNATSFIAYLDKTLATLKKTQQLLFLHWLDSFDKSVFLKFVGAFNVTGFYLKLKGKLGGFGGSRTRCFIIRYGKYSRSNRVTINNFYFKQLLNTHGAVGMNLIISYF